MTPTLQHLPGAVDIGNSRIKIVVAGRYFVHDLQNGWTEAMHKFFWSFPGKHLLLGVSSVNMEAKEVFDTELRKRSTITTQPLELLLQSQRFVDVSSVQGIGSDRVLGLIGALHYDPVLIKPIVTIDCGTAMTVNALSASRRCLGGAILPGISTQFRALHTFTSALPEVEPAFENVAVGTTTAQAMRVGIVQGAAGAVRFILDNLIAHEFEGQQPFVFIAGGEAPLLAKSLELHLPDLILAPDLVLDGISALMAHWMEITFRADAKNKLAE